MMVRAWVLGSLVSWASWGVGGCLDDSDLGGDLAVLASHSEASDRGSASGQGDPTATATPLRPLQPLQPDDGFWMAVRGSGNVLATLSHRTGWLPETTIERVT